jgi:hypothetical protein
MSFCFRPSTGSARFDIIRYKLSDIGLSILPSNDQKSFVDTRMSRDWMIIKTLKDAEPKISGFWNKNLLINPDESHISTDQCEYLELLESAWKDCTAGSVS